MAGGLFASTLGLMGGRLVQPFFALVLFFASARILTVGEFGLYVLLMGLIILFQSLASLGLGSVVAREIGRRPDEEGAIIGSALLLGLPASVGSFGLLLALSWGLKDSGEFLGLTAILALSLPLSILMQFGESVFTAHNSGVYLLHINLVEQVVRVGLSLVALGLGFGLYGLVATYVLGRFLAASGVALIFFRQKMSPPLRTDRANLHYLLGRLSSFAPMNILANLCFRADVIILAWLMTDEALGIYGCAMRLVSISFLGPESIVVAAFPHVSRAWSEREDDFGVRVRATMELLLAVGFVGAGAMAVFAAFFLTPIFGLKYAASAPILAFLGFMLPAHGLNVQLGLLLQAVNRERTALRLVAFGTALVFGLIALGVVWGGVTGAAVGMLTAIWVMALMHLLVTSRLELYELPRRSPPIRALGLMAAALVAAVCWRPAGDAAFSLAFAAAALAPLAGAGLWAALRPSRIRQTIS